MAPLLHSKRAPEKVNILAQGELPRHILNHLTILPGNQRQARRLHFHFERRSKYYDFYTRLCVDLERTCVNCNNIVFISNRFRI